MNTITDFFTYNLSFVVGNILLATAIIVTMFEKRKVVKTTARVILSIGIFGIILSATPISSVLFRIQGVMIILLMIALHFGSRTLAPARALIRIFIVGVCYMNVQDYLKDQQLPALSIDTSRSVFVLGSDISLAPNGWVSQLETRLDRNVVNISTKNTSLSTAINQAELLPDNDIVVVTLLGLDDLRSETLPDPRHFEENLRSLFGELSRGKRTVVMFGLPTSITQKNYLQIQQDLAAMYGIKLIPRTILFSILDNDPSYPQSLSPEGHRKLADTVATLL